MPPPHDATAVIRTAVRLPLPLRTTLDTLAEETHRTLSATVTILCDYALTARDWTTLSGSYNAADHLPISECPSRPAGHVAATDNPARGHP